MNASAIADIIENFEVPQSFTDRDGNVQTYTDSGFSYWHHELAGEPAVDVPGVGAVQVIHTHGGSEGEGEHVATVYKITAADGSVRHFEKQGFYASYDGTTWDGDFFEVAPAQKWITVYEPAS